MYGGVEEYIHTFLTSALGGAAWLASRFGSFAPKGFSTVHTAQDAGYASETVWTWCRKEENLPCREYNPELSGCRPSDQAYINCSATKVF